MKNTLKTFAIVIFGIIAVLYFSFLLILPPVAGFFINSRDSEIKSFIKQNSGLNVDYSDLKIIATPLLSIGIKASSIDITMPDNSKLFNSGKIEGRLSLPSLIFKTIKISCVKVENPFLNIDIIQGNKFAVSDLFAGSKEQTDTEVSVSDNVQANIYGYKCKIDKFLLKNYKIYITDTKTSHYLLLQGDDFNLKFDEKLLSVKTDVSVFSDENKNISADLDITTYIPELQLNNDNTSQNNNEISFVNPVEIFRQYDFKSNIQAKLNIKNSGNFSKIDGNVNINDTSFKIGDVSLPKSYLNLKFNGQKVDINTNLYLKEKEHIIISGNVNYSDKPSTDINVKSDKIYLSSVLQVAQALMDSFNIKNSLSSISASGYISANTKIKTDFKKLESSGNIELVNGSVFDKKSGLNISSIKSLLSLDNSILKIKNTQATVNGTPFIVEGSINQDSSTDIKIYTKNLQLANLYSTFAPADVKKLYLIQNGLLSLNLDLKGKLQEIKPIINSEIVNLVINDKADGILITNGLCKINIASDLKSYKGDIKNTNLVISIPGLPATVRNSQALVNFDDKNITIKPSDFIINSSSTFTLGGDVKNYMKNPVINIWGNGSIQTSVLKDFAGKDSAPFISSKGLLPVKLNISGNDKLQNVIFKIYSSSDAYITPVNFKQAIGQKSVIQIDADISNNKITFKNSGFYTNVSESKQSEILGKQLAALSGSILLDKNLTFNSVKLSTVGAQNISVCAFDKSSLISNVNVIISGTAANPKLTGNISAYDISLPQLLTKISKADISLNDTIFGYDLNGISLNGSSINISGSGLLDYKPVVTLYNTKITSDYIDADKTMKVADAASKIPAFAPSVSSSYSSSSTSSSSTSSLFPVKITSGSVNVAKLKSGDIIASDISSKLLLSSDVVYLNNLQASAFDGNLKGDVSMNLASSAMRLKVSGSKMDADKTVSACAAMKNTLFGTLSFNADVSLKGATYTEQMQSLKGNADFTITNGQFGSFGKFETFLKADNLASISFISTATGSLINKISPHNTAEFSKLNGHVSFNKGLMTINSITSSGKNMSLFINGNMNLLNNYANMQILGRVSNEITSLLGPLNQLNPINILKSKNSTFAAVTSTLLNAINQVSAPSELDKIPQLTPVQDNSSTANFIVKLNGNIEKPQSAIKSFKWLSAKSDITQAENIINPVNTVKEVINNLPKTKEDTVKNIKEAGKNMIFNIGKELLSPSSDLNNE